MAQLACLLCGADTGEVTVRIVEWHEPIGTRRYESLPRCRDVDACHDRVTRVLAEDWPVADGRSIGRRLAADPEPLQSVDSPRADGAPALEDPAWLVGEPAEASR